MLPAEVIAQAADVVIGLFTVMIFLVCKLHADLVGFLIRNLAGEKRLYQVVGFIWIGLFGF